MTITSTPPHNFRKDINGLRAIAVLGVLLFHLFAYLKYQRIVPDVDLFSGGYVGVDIFFVISGFLMTAIIVRRLEAGKFSVWEFWKRRAGRICPALLCLVVLIMIAGCFMQYPNVLKETARESMRALAFISNFWFARDQGYFTTSVLDKILLHTWSLSVEWQFYLLYPLLLLLWGKIVSLKTLPHFVAALGIVSLALSFFFSNSNSAYFMLHVRAWELLAGGIIFLLPPLKLKPTTARILELTALAVIILNIMLAKPMQGWSTLSVLPAVAATAFMLWFNIERSCLSNVIFQFTGKISYSLYLIHWPVIVTAAKLNLLNYILPIFIFIVLYASLSYKFIETKRKWHMWIIVIYFAVASFAQYLTSQDGITWGNSAMRAYTSDYSKEFYGGRGIHSEGKIHRGPMDGDAELIIFGDSYAKQYGNVLNQNVPYLGVFADGQSYFEHFAVSVDDNARYSPVYFKNYQHLLQHENTKIVLISHNWHLYLAFKAKPASPEYEDLEKRPAALEKALLCLADRYPNKNFYLVGQAIGLGAVMPDCMLLRDNTLPFLRPLFSKLNCPTTYQADFTETARTNSVLQKIAEQRPNLNFIDPNPAICDEGDTCLAVKDGMLIFSDGGHLSLVGAQLIGQHILRQISTNEPDFNYGKGKVSETSD